MELKEVQKKIRRLTVSAEENYSVGFSGCCATVYRKGEVLIAGHVLDVLQELRKTQ